MEVPLSAALSAADLAVAGAAVLTVVYVAIGIGQRDRSCPRRGEDRYRDGE
jgi:hypothetical protein